MCGPGNSPLQKDLTNLMKRNPTRMRVSGNGGGGGGGGGGWLGLGLGRLGQVRVRVRVRVRRNYYIKILRDKLGVMDGVTMA